MKIAVLVMFVIMTDLCAVEEERADYYFMLAEKALLNDDIESAKDNFEKTIKMGGDSSFLRMRISEINELYGEHDIAVEQLKKSIEMDPENVNALMMNTELLITEKKYKDALQESIRVLELDPYNRDATSYKAAMLIKLGKIDEAQAVLDEYKQVVSNDPFPWFYAGLILQLDHNKHMAEKCYTAALEIDPSYQAAINGLITIYKSSNNKEETIKKLESISDKIPAIKDEIIKLSIIEASKGKNRVKSEKYYDKAIKYIDEELDLDPTNYSRLLQKAMLQEEHEKKREAMKTLEEALLHHPDDERILYYLAILNSGYGQKKKALSLMEQIIKINPDNVDALNYVGYYYAEEKPEKIEEAEKLIKKALQIMPESYYIMDSMGWVLYKKGDLKRSKSFLESALKASLKDKAFEQEIFDHLLVLYKKTNDKEGQLKLKKVLSEMLNSEHYSDKRTEINKTLESFDVSVQEKNK
jgi:tetratricopeptide (TPR) repeat protein